VRDRGRRRGDPDRGRPGRRAIHRRHAIADPQTLLEDVFIDATLRRVLIDDTSLHGVGGAAGDAVLLTRGWP
jgi:hypothetical protein